MKEIKISGIEFKKLLMESSGVPNGIYETSLKVYNDIISYLNNNNKQIIESDIDFIINKEYYISDFKIKNIKIEIVVDYQLNSLPLNIKYVGNYNKKEITNDFKIKEIEYNVESNKTIFNFSAKTGYILNLQNILKYFKTNEDYIISAIAHEFKHKYDSFKKPINPIIKHAEYQSMEYNSTIPTIDYIIKGMYLTSDFEKLVKNSEFYALLRQKNINKTQFNDFLLKSETYTILNDYRNIKFEDIINKTKEKYIDNVNDFLINLNYSIDKMSIDTKINLCLTVTFLAINDLKLDYIYKKLFSPTSEIFLNFKENEIYYKKMVTKTNSETTTLFFKNKIKEINYNSDIMIKKLSKLYTLMHENKTFNELQINRNNKIIKWSEI